MKSKYYIILFLTAIFISLIICMGDFKYLFSYIKDKNNYINLKKDNTVLISSVDKINEEIIYLEEQYKYIENINELDKEIEDKKEEISKLESEISSINKEIVNYEKKVSEIKKYIVK